MGRAARLALLAAAILGAAVIGAWRLIDDEPLDPKVRALIALPTAPPAKDNGYFLIIGFGVDDGVEPERAGRRYVAAHDRLLAAQKNLDYFDGDAAFASPRIRLPGQKPCARDVKSAPECLAEYRRHAALALQQLAELAPYLQRYRRLKSSGELVSPFSRTSVQSANPGFEVVIRIGDLVDASIALRMESPSQRAEALRELAEEVAFWRQFVGKSDWILSQMVAARMLTYKLVLASELMAAHREIVREHADLLARITEPMRAEEATVASAIRVEAFFAASLFWDLASSDNEVLWSVLGDDFADRVMKVAGPILPAGAFRPQATLNDYIPVMQAFVSAAEGPPARFSRAIAAANESTRSAREFRLRDLFFNPLGRLLVQSAVGPDFASYAHRLWDVVALSRLVELQRRLIGGTVAATDVASTVAATRELGDLYTGEPARWDAASGTLSFENRGKRFMRDGRVAVTYRP